MGRRKIRSYPFGLIMGLKTMGKWALRGSGRKKNCQYPAAGGQGKTIFKDAELCAQFLRENIDHPIIRRVRAAYGERDAAYMEAARWKKLALAAGVKEDTPVGV